MGIGTAAPAVPLDVSGSGHTAKIGKAGTAATWLTSYNDGNTLHFGVEDSNGADIAVGSSAYAGFLLVTLAAPCNLQRLELSERQ